MSHVTPAAFDAMTVPLSDGIGLIEASAGTGKTFAITRLVLRLLLEERVSSLSQILVVTFTDKATQELVTRIRRTLREADRVWSATPPLRTDKNGDLFQLQERYPDGGAMIRAALGSLDDLGVSTIHGFCQRILAENALETRVPFRTSFIEDDTEPLLRAATDWTRKTLLQDAVAAERFVSGKGTLAPMVEKFSRPFRRQQGTRFECNEGDDMDALIGRFLADVDDSFEREKARRQLQGFEDLLRNMCRVLTEEGPDGPLAVRIRSRYRVALIDEFQDTDSTQFPIFDTAFRGCPLFLIGDPKQSIYGFRGADINAYLTAAEGVANRYTLTRNYRSTPDCVAAVESLFTRRPDPFKYDPSRINYPLVSAATTPDPVGTLASDGAGALVWWWVDKSHGTGDYVGKERALDMIFGAVVNEIVQLIADGLPHKCVAILMRTGRHTRQMKDLLDAAGVPAVISGAEDVLASDEATELARISSAIAAPHDRRAVAAAMSTRIWGLTAGEIAAVLADGADAEFSAITNEFSAFREMWRTRGVSSAIGAVLAARNATERLLSLSDGERRLTNIRHLTELLHTASVESGLTPETVVEWIAAEDAGQNTPDRRMQRLETDSEAVQILTMHKAKGLEFDVVFCPTLFDSDDLRKGPFGRTPVIVTEDGLPVMDIGSPAFAAREAKATFEACAEALRLTYVAVTRAVHRCYIAFGEIGRGEPWERSPLAHLLGPIPEKTSYRESIAALVAASEGRMTLRDLQPNVPTLRAAVAEQPARQYTPRPLTITANQLDSWRLTSFTGMVANAPDAAARDVSDPSVLPEMPTVPTGFRAFPAGAQAGNALHDIFERLDFARIDHAPSIVLVERTLAAYGLTGKTEIAAQRLDDVVAMLRRTCSAIIPSTDFALRDIAVAESLREWRFDLSAASASPGRIAEALAEHGSPHAKAYAPVLRTLRDHALSGYLGGFVDLAFPRGGKWWIVDWKSNQLGAADARYAPAVLGEVMMEKHYTLQYHLYLLAMHRFLRIRVAGYDPVTHWGGVAYAFLRGIGENDAARGWFIDTPTPALLDALDTAVGRRT